MSTPDSGTTNNVANDGANVGVQAECIYDGVTIYQTLKDQPPEEKFRTGVNFLKGGMPARAHELIDEAIGNGYETSEVWFHWLLALLSGKTFRQFSRVDRVRLESAREKALSGIHDGWKDGTEIVFRLVDSIDTSRINTAVSTADFDKLGELQRELILRHLELFLNGSLKDQMWQREKERVQAERMAKGRASRIWTFFEPIPAEYRVRRPNPPEPTIGWWLLAVSTAVAGLAGASVIGLILETRISLPVLVGYSFGIVIGGLLSVTKGLELHLKTEQIRAIDQRWNATSHDGYRPEDVFARGVKNKLDHYFYRYVPEGEDRKAWLNGTVGIRRHLLEEIVDLYPEKKINADHVAWLIRHEVSRVKQDWQAGGLPGYAQLQDKTGLIVEFVFSLILLIGTGVTGFGLVIWKAPLEMLPIVLLTIIFGLPAVGIWCQFMLERSRFKTGQEESSRRKDDRKAAFNRWQEKLKDKPDDFEMAAWLDCDRKVLMDQVMQHCKLSPRDVIADAFIEAPALSYKRARVSYGPWRYSRYRLLVFLLTPDGVRQATVELDFEKGSFHDWRWTSYRFDSIVSIAVQEQDDHQRTFELVLMNGLPITVRVTEPKTEAHGEEDPERLTEAAMDAAGLSNAFQVLEGIAAEGKEWIERKTSEVRHAHGPRPSAKAS